MFVLAPFLVLAGCGDAGPLVPLDGTWETVSAAVVEDGCSFFPDSEDLDRLPASYTLSDPSEAGFTLLGDEENDLQSCTLSGSSFTCEPYTETESGSSGMASYTVTSEIQTSGVLDSEHEASLSISMDVDCEGSMCDDVADYFETSFPCSSIVSQQIQAPLD